MSLLRVCATPRELSEGAASSLVATSVGFWIPPHLVSWYFMCTFVRILVFSSFSNASFPSKSAHLGVDTLDMELQVSK